MEGNRTDNSADESGNDRTDDRPKIQETTASERSPVKAERKPGLVRRTLKTLARTVLYGLFLVAAVVLILGAVEGLARYALSRTVAAQVYPKDFSMVRKDFTQPVSHYDYDFVPGVCLEYNISKGNKYEYANNAGFREPLDIPMEKPADEYRIFLNGGSTAYGLGAVGEAAPEMSYYGLEYRETISHMLEMILNATAPIPGKKIRVYNTAVWGYSYQHHIMRYLTKLRLYEPDLVVSLDGANELPPVSRMVKDWDYFREGQFNGIMREIFAYNTPGLSSYLTLWLKNNTFFMSLVWSGKDVFQVLDEAAAQNSGAPRANQPNGDASAASVEEKSRMVDRNVGTVVRMVENYHSALQNDEVRHIIALQPWLYLSKKPLHEKEKILLELPGYRTHYGVPSDRIYKLLIEKIGESAKNKGYFLVDFSEYFDDVPEWVFTDWCHLTAGANYLVAKELANLIKEHFLGKPLGRGDAIEKKEEHFWDLAASATVVYAPAPESPDQGPDKMLSGYPSESLYSAGLSNPDDRGEVILDLGELKQISRMRLVWGDRASTPGQWVVEVSTDQETWRPFVRVQDGSTDNYSRWPGFEYYAAEPMDARYLRYKPLGSGPQAIKLRLWSVFR
jgi:hypothetical protein